MAASPEQRASSSRRGYDYAWQKARDGYLRRHPLCCLCDRQGKVVAASVVDHIVPHRGDKALFWDRSNWQPLCKHCHDSIKQQLERSGRVAGCGADGRPLDPNHHWNRPTPG